MPDSAQRPRDKAKFLVAQQLALANGVVWAKIDEKRRFKFLTEAGNIIATVERLQRDFRWE